MVVVVVVGVALWWWLVLLCCGGGGGWCCSVVMVVAGVASLLLLVWWVLEMVAHPWRHPVNQTKLLKRPGDHASIPQAHAKGLHIIMDMVLNHAGPVFEYEGDSKFDAFEKPIKWVRNLEPKELMQKQHFARRGSTDPICSPRGCGGTRVRAISARGVRRNLVTRARTHPQAPKGQHH